MLNTIFTETNEVQNGLVIGVLIERSDHDDPSVRTAVVCACGNAERGALYRRPSPYVSAPVTH